LQAVSPLHVYEVDRIASGLLLRAFGGRLSFFRDGRKASTWAGALLARRLEPARQLAWLGVDIRTV
jgi:hypothetical protein